MRLHKTMANPRIFSLCNVAVVIVLIDLYPGGNGGNHIGTPAAPENCNPFYDVYRLRQILVQADRVGSVQAIENVLDILVRRTWIQRREITELYETAYNRTLVQDFGISDNLIADALLSTRPNYYARALHDAITNNRITRADEIIEILCPHTDGEISDILLSYEKQYGIIFQINPQDEMVKFIYDLCIGNRYGAIDETRVALDARRLFEEGIKNGLFKYLLTHNREEFRQISLKYKKLSKREIADALSEELTGDVRGYLISTIASCITSKNDYFARKLSINSYMDTKEFNRIIILRSELDIGDIEKSFKKLYGKSLATFMGMPGIPKYLEKLIPSS